MNAVGDGESAHGADRAATTPGPTCGGTGGEDYRRAVEASPDGILVLDRRGHVLYVNRAGAKLIGRPREAMQGAPLALSLRADDSEVELLRPGGDVGVAEVRTAQTEWGGVPARLVCLRDITERRRTERDVRLSRARLRNLAARLHSVREEERTAIAREIHDQLGQTLTALKMDLAWLAQNLPAEYQPMRERARSMDALMESTLDMVRRLSSQLRPAVLDDLGLEAAIEWQAQEFAKRTGCECVLDLDAGSLEPDRNRDIVIFRILQEALTNVARHAQARRVEVGLHAAPSQLTLRVRDDGRGITDEAIVDTSSLGVIGMRERAGSLGGRVYLRRAEEGGTVVELNVPLPA